MKFSPIIAGCMLHGSTTPCVMDDKELIFKILKILKHCYNQGSCTFDSANVYSNGKGERLLGEFLKHYNINKETIVILSKIYTSVDESLGVLHLGFSELTTWPPLKLANQKGLFRKHILDGGKSVESSGAYIDVLQIHRMDHKIPMEETIKALDDVIESEIGRAHV